MDERARGGPKESYPFETCSLDRASDRSDKCLVSCATKMSQTPRTLASGLDMDPDARVPGVWLSG